MAIPVDDLEYVFLAGGINDVPGILKALRDVSASHATQAHPHQKKTARARAPVEVRAHKQHKTPPKKTRGNFFLCAEYIWSKIAPSLYADRRSM